MALAGAVVPPQRPSSPLTPSLCPTLRTPTLCLIGLLLGLLLLLSFVGLECIILLPATLFLLRLLPFPQLPLLGLLGSLLGLPLLLSL